MIKLLYSDIANGIDICKKLKKQLYVSDSVNFIWGLRKIGTAEMCGPVLTAFFTATGKYVQ